MTYQEKITKILNLHRSKEALNITESKEEVNMIMYACWLNWEIKTISKLKANKEREEMLRSMKELVDTIYRKYYVNSICLK